MKEAQKYKKSLIFLFEVFETPEKKRSLFEVDLKKEDDEFSSERKLGRVAQ